MATPRTSIMPVPAHRWPRDLAREGVDLARAWQSLDGLTPANPTAPDRVQATWHNRKLGVRMRLTISATTTAQHQLTLEYHALAEAVPGSTRRQTPNAQEANAAQQAREMAAALSASLAQDIAAAETGGAPAPPQAADHPSRRRQRWARLQHPDPGAARTQRWRRQTIRLDGVTPAQLAEVLHAIHGQHGHRPHSLTLSTQRLPQPVQDAAAASAMGERLWGRLRTALRNHDTPDWRQALSGQVERWLGGLLRPRREPGRAQTAGTELA